MVFVKAFEQTQVIISEWIRIMDNSEVLNSANSILQEVFVLDEKLLFFSSSVTNEKGWDKQVDVQVTPVACYGGKKKK